jgi:hypothetical protein
LNDGLTFYNLECLKWADDEAHEKYWNEEGAIKIT